MKKKLYIAIMLLMVGLGYGRAAVTIPDAYTHSVDSLAMYIDCNCNNDREKVETIYTWIINNLNYNLYTTFTSRNEPYSEERELAHTLQTREGVCRQFARLFIRVAERMGIPAYVVSGYNRHSTGGIMPEPHDWVAAKVNAKWYLYDPTFGMGYVENYKFFRRPQMKYCHMDPKEMIKTHMPYDPIWQLLPQPLTFDEFDNGLPHKPSAIDCNFNDSIIAYTALPWIQQLVTAHRRVMSNGKGNRLTLYFLQLTESNIKVYRKQRVVNAHNAAMKYQNSAVDLYDAFINYKEASFKPVKEEELVRNMLAKAEQAIREAERLHRSVIEIPEEYESAMSNLGASIAETIAAIDGQKDFLERYYKATKSQRRQMLKKPS